MPEILDIRSRRLFLNDHLVYRVNNATDIAFRHGLACDDTSEELGRVQLDIRRMPDLCIQMASCELLDLIQLFAGKLVISRDPVILGISRDDRIRFRRICRSGIRDHRRSVRVICIVCDLRVIGVLCIVRIARLVI